METSQWICSASVNGADNCILTWNSGCRFIRMKDNRITIPKAQNTKNHPTETSLLKTTFLRNNPQHI